MGNCDLANTTIAPQLEESNFAHGALRAGILGVRVVDARKIRTPLAPHEDSNIVPFVLRVKNTVQV